MRASETPPAAMLPSREIQEAVLDRRAQMAEAVVLVEAPILTAPVAQI
jgi:hypothetical protein